jgi:L-serine deaminase
MCVNIHYTVTKHPPLQSDYDKALYNAARFGETSRVRELLQDPSVNINYQGAVSAIAHTVPSMQLLGLVRSVLTILFGF